MSHVAQLYVWHGSFICLHTFNLHEIEIRFNYWLIPIFEKTSPCHMTHSYVWHNFFIWVIWLIHMSHAAQLYVWCGSCIRMTGPTHMEKKSNSNTFWCQSLRWLPLWHDSCTCATCLFDLCHMTHSYVSRGSFMWEGKNPTQIVVNLILETNPPCHTSPIHVCDMTHLYVCINDSHVRDDSLIFVAWLIHMCDKTHLHENQFQFQYSLNPMFETTSPCDMTHSHVRHDSFICATWLIHLFHVAHLYVSHGSLIWKSYSIPMLTEFDLWDDFPPRACDMTHSYAWHDSCIRVTWLSMTHSVIDSFMCVTWLICDVTHSYVWNDSFISFI